MSLAFRAHAAFQRFDPRTPGDPGRYTLAPVFFGAEYTHAQALIVGLGTDKHSID
jgi:hypothetical protein